MTTFARVHLNGTSAESLIQENLNAYRALDKAIEALQAACPNGRDYYLDGPEAFKSAQAEHIARVQAVAKVQQDIVAIVENLQEQQDARSSRRAS